MPANVLRASRLATVFLLASMILGGARLAAQSGRTLRAGTDVAVHAFQPALPPALAAAQPGLPARTDSSPDIGPLALQQMAALIAEKNARTPAQIKIDSQILYTSRMLRNQPAAPGVPYLDTCAELDANDALVLDLRADVTPDLLSRLTALGIHVVESEVRFHSILALVPASLVETIAAWPDIHWVGPRARGETHGNVKGSLPRTLQAALQTSSYPANAFNGLDSEGDAAHQANLARGVFGIDGTGLKIGVLSDGDTSLAASQALLALPANVTTLTGQAGAGDEGTAMMEIIHDLAPGAQLYFATAGNSITSFAANIQALQAAGCSIICDDEFYFVETPFQNGQAPSVLSTSQGGIVTQAINTVAAQGVLYFTAAGNEGSEDAGNSSNYEGDFLPMAAVSPLPAGKVHNFGSGQGYDTITAPGDQVIGLWWADPLGGSSNDYDLYVLDSTGSTILAASTNIQNGTQDPVETVGSANVLDGGRIVVFQNTGAQNRFFDLQLFRGELAVNTPGVISGHGGASGAFSMAATPAATSAGYPTPDGPYPGPFTTSAVSEFFSSDGPRQIFFNADSSAITPGNYSSTGGAVLDKPDFTAADGVTVSGVGGFGSPFYGTSAAAPHAAAIAALVKSGAPGASNAALLGALTSTAIDIMSAGWDRDSGHGILMPMPALTALGAQTWANPVVSAASAAPNPGSGDGFLEIGDGGKLTLTLTNRTPSVAMSNAVATLNAVTPGVIMAMPNFQPFAGLAVQAAGSNPAPFLFTVGPTVDPATEQLEFVLTVQATGLPGGTKDLPFTVPFNQQNTFSNTLGTTLTGLPGRITFATGTQVNRINRNGVLSSCANPKAFPGVITGNHTFDAYTFTAGTSTCATFSFTSSAEGINLFASLYSPYAPATISSGYLGDAGLSGNTQAFTVDVVAGQTYTLVVNDVAGNPLPAPAAPNTYTVTLPNVQAASFNNPPVAIARNVTVSAGPAGTAAANVNNGSYDPDGNPITLSQNPPGPYPFGTTTVILTATDPLGAMGQASASVTVTGPSTVTTVTTVTSATGSYGSTTLSALVAATGSTPTGSVAFYENGILLGTGTVTSDGQASAFVPTLAVGVHQVVASFAGTGTFGNSSSPATPVTIAKAPTTVTMVPSGTGYLGQAVTFTATVSNSVSIAATGSVTFMDGATTLGTVPLASGSAAFTTSSLQVGAHSITVTYSGDGNDSASVSTALSTNVAQPAVIVTTSQTLVTVANGSSANLQFTVSSLGTLTAPVSFAVSGLPPETTISFSSTAPNPANGPVPVDVTLATTARPQASTRIDIHVPTGGWAGGALLGCGVLALPWARRRRRFGLLISLMAMLCGLTACGGSGNGGVASGGGGVVNPGTPAGTYLVIIHSSSAGATPSATQISLTVD